jgi:hypothetical protein
MKEAEKPMTEQESLALITSMINRAKDVNHSTGLTSIMWGLVIIVCSLVRLAEIHFGFRLPFDIYLLTVLAIVPTIYFSIKEKKESRVKGYKDSFIDFTWLSFGISIFLLSFIMNVLFANLRPLNESVELATGKNLNYLLYEHMASFFLMLYGLPTFITGASMKFKPMIWGGIICWVSCLAALYTPVKIDLLLTAISALFAWFIPGTILEKNYRNAKKELGAQHV